MHLNHLGWSQRDEEMLTARPPHTDMYEPQQMAEAGEVTQRVLIKDNAPR